jgi:hypothetical protein
LLPVILPVSVCPALAEFIVTVLVPQVNVPVFAQLPLTFMLAAMVMVTVPLFEKLLVDNVPFVNVVVPLFEKLPESVIVLAATVKVPAVTVRLSGVLFAGIVNVTPL